MRLKKMVILPSCILTFKFYKQVHFFPAKCCFHVQLIFAEFVPGDNHSTELRPVTSNKIGNNCRGLSVHFFSFQLRLQIIIRLETEADIVKSFPPCSY